MRTNSRHTSLPTQPPRIWAAFLLPGKLAAKGRRAVRRAVLFAFLALLGACSSAPPKLPYPAFVDVDSLETIFMASLPGVRAKQLAGDPQTRRTSNRVDLPIDWKGTSGSVPGRSIEIFVLAGELRVSDIVLKRGGYAFFPAGSLGFNLSAAEGARILYFVNDTDPESVIRSPIIIDSQLLLWEATSTDGVALRELRNDPGNGAKTWLLRVAPGTAVPWQSSTTLREGFLMSGEATMSECFNGKVVTASYQEGGYFYRPADVMSGGPDSVSKDETIWFLRETAKGETSYWPNCVAASR